ncbi:MAG TPA: methionine adenosyltransferase [Candidatus Borkfalkia faecigallinarum]|uniref:S-adenosylmethionine synthase n=1 Tax=Candidatus Borkfalkia faecigallinarum TaxID=2838509 RepID=A0A9D1VTC9_9FIRM|nr:methionine adenosyltransferase [Candidatus Borkfalkia faecigallinarum]
MRRFFTSESVTEGHPDKVCDQISDAVLDAVLSHDPASRAAIECCATTGMVLVMGELSTDCYVDISKIVRDTVKEIGYTQGQGFSYNSLAVITAIHGQSADIAMGVDASVESRAGGDAFDRIGAGDQGMMFGYAVNETEELMPLTAVLAHKLARRLAQVRKSGLLPYLRPDGKTQVTVEYEGKKPVRVDTVVVSAQHDEFVSQEQLHADIRQYVIDEIIDPALLDGDTKYYINPTGRFEIGGPEGDSGLTGRKIIVDTYGGRCAHGGGAFSGKDATKVDRSAAYMARYVCKNIVAAGLADECELQLAYAIGVARPVSLFIDTFGTGRVPEETLVRIVRENFDLRPQAIIEKLGLRRPVFRETAAYGHFGRPQFPWERTDMAETLRKYL